jgi:hypothetical protein
MRRKLFTVLSAASLAICAAGCVSCERGNLHFSDGFSEAMARAVNDFHDRYKRWPKPDEFEASSVSNDPRLQKPRFRLLYFTPKPEGGLLVRYSAKPAGMCCWESGTIQLNGSGKILLLISFDPI